MAEDQEEQAATVEQAAVLELPFTTRAFVLAGPGAGKTWTLLRRARTLVERDGLEPAELLMLSFTRAVVRELRRRDRAAYPLASAFPETFDAFATRLLAEHADDDRWARHGFDARIVLATELVRDGAAATTLDAVRHIFVDEVQDLVGPRADFVAALLKAHGGGFTAFGDPAQAIYDHERGPTGRNLIDVLEDGLADVRLHLRGNHRATAELADRIAEVRDGLLQLRAGEEPADDAFAEVETLGAFEDLPDLLPGLLGDVAVLCRDNATALLLSRRLHERGVEHRIRRGSTDRPIAGWVAAVLAGSMRLARSQLDERFEHLRAIGFPALPDDELAWRLLQRLDPRARGQAVRATEIGNRISTGRIPYELCDEPGHALVISSVHRAKGLEFDACVVVEWPRRNEQDETLEQRVLFVALSRARRDVLHGNRPTKREPWYRSAQAGGRFIKRGGQEWQTFGIEVRGDDVHDVDPAGTVGFVEDPGSVQERLVQHVRPGDPVELERLEEYDFGDVTLPSYAVRHASGTIGVTGFRFGEALKRRVGSGMPQRMTDVRIDDLETVKGPMESADAAGLGRSGLWLRPRLVGLADFDWREC